MSKITSILLTFLILLSSSGISYGQHFCGGHEVSAELSIGEKDLSCGMAMDESSCCDDKITKVETDENFTTNGFNFEFSNSLDYLIPIFTCDLITIDFVLKNEFLSDYSPPPLERDLNILYDTFLI